MDWHVDSNGRLKRLRPFRFIYLFFLFYFSSHLGFLVASKMGWPNLIHVNDLKKRNWLLKKPTSLSGLSAPQEEEQKLVWGFNSLKPWKGNGVEACEREYIILNLIRGFLK